MAIEIKQSPWSFSGSSDSVLDDLSDDLDTSIDAQVDQALSNSTNTLNGLVETLSNVQSVKLPTLSGTGFDSLSLQSTSLDSPTLIDWSYEPFVATPASIEYTQPVMGPLLTVTLPSTAPPAAPTLSYNAPPTPSIQVVSPDFPEMPVGVSTGSIGSISVGAAPTFSVSAPNISTIQAPSSFSKSAPTMGVLSERQYPNAPAKNLPVSPVLRNFDLPASPELINLEFSGNLLNELDAPPDLTFNFTEVIYDSELLDTLKTKIFDLVHTARQTGLDEIIKQTILNDGHVRTNSVSAGLVDQVNQHFIRMGWEAPDDFAERVLEAEEFSVAMCMTDLQSDNIALSELEQQNFVFAIGKAVELEGQMIALHNKIQQRSFAAAKAIVTAAVSIYKLKASYFNTAVLLYGAQATVYKSKIQAALAQVDLYKAQIEGQELISDLNDQLVEIYTAQIEAVISLHEIYKAELEAVKTKLEGDALKIKQFEAAVEAFTVEIQAKALEYDGYKAAMTGEELKAKIFNSLVGAFGSQIEAYSTGVDAQVLKLDADIKANIEAPLQIAEQAVKEFVAIIGAESKYLKAVAKSDSALVDIFSVLIDSEKGRVSNLAESYSAEVDAYKAVNAGVEAQVKIAASINDTATDIYKSEVSAEVSSLESVAALDSIKVDIIRALTQLDIARAKIGVANYKSATDKTNSQITTRANINKAKVEQNRAIATTTISKMESSLDIAETEISAAIEEKDTTVKVMISAAQAQAQIIAAKASTANIHKNFSGTKTESTSVNVGHFSYSENDSTIIQG